MSEPSLVLDVEPGFGPVADAFRRNVLAGAEIGAACAVVADGRPVVHVYGGIADAATGRPWADDTLQLVFSTTKGLAALAVAMLVDRSTLDYDATVSTWWPEFADAGKADVTLRQLVSHQAGLCAIDTPIDFATIADLDALASHLAGQRPAWPPGTAHGYHAVTFGWYVGELVRRVAGRTLGRFIADEIASPLGADVYLGLPASLEPRVAPYVAFDPSTDLDSTSASMLALADPSSLPARAFANPKELQDPSFLNRPDAHRIELPSTNGIASALGLATVYGSLTSVEPVLCSPRVLDQAATLQVDGVDLVIGRRTAFALGFQKPQPEMPFSPNQSSFGHAGLGGSLAFADRDAGVGFGYVMNRLGASIGLDPRCRTLVDALYRCL